jgi:hypothetical protein
MSDELKERNILKLILIVRFACATLDVGHPRHIRGEIRNIGNLSWMRTMEEYLILLISVWDMGEKVSEAIPRL